MHHASPPPPARPASPLLRQLNNFKKPRSRASSPNRSMRWKRWEKKEEEKKKENKNLPLFTRPANTLPRRRRESERDAAGRQAHLDFPEQRTEKETAPQQQQHGERKYHCLFRSNGRCAIDSTCPTRSPGRGRERATQTLAREGISVLILSHCLSETRSCVGLMFLRRVRFVHFLRVLCVLLSTGALGSAEKHKIMDFLRGRRIKKSGWRERGGGEIPIRGRFRRCDCCSCCCHF